MKRVQKSLDFCPVSVSVSIGLKRPQALPGAGVACFLGLTGLAQTTVSRRAGLSMLSRRWKVFGVAGVEA